MKKTIVKGCLLLFVAGAPLLLGAQPLEYIPLEPLPGVDQSGQADFGDLISGFFRILINLGAFVAVTVLVIGGITYMVSEKSFSKLIAKERIKAALWGLAILAGAWLLLYTINPQLLTLTLDQEPVTVVPPPEFKPDQLILTKDQMDAALKYYAENNAWLPDGLYKNKGGFLFSNDAVWNPAVVTLNKNLQELCPASNYGSAVQAGLTGFTTGGSVPGVNVVQGAIYFLAEAIREDLRGVTSEVITLPGQAVGLTSDETVKICVSYNL